MNFTPSLRQQALRCGALVLALAAPAGAFAQVANVNVDQEMQAQAQLMATKPEGPADQPWLQHIGGKNIDTAKYKKKGPYTLCFSNASVGNPWRVVGWNTMQAEVELNKADIKGFEYADAQGKDEKQISDIRSLVNSGKCDALIVSPNTSAALTPAVEEACKKLPVVTFDRSVNSLCPVTAVRSVGGYAWGKVGADFIAANAPKGGKVLVLRTAPGVDLFETRWAAAKKVFDDAGLKVVGNEFVGGDRAKTKATVADYLSRSGKIDAVWVDLGAVSVAVAEAFEDAGQPYPVITGEDQQDYLQAWKKNGFKGIAPTYPAYQWRTAVIAALKTLKGEPLPGPTWVLPQPSITAKELPLYVNEKLPPLHYSMCGCEKMPGYPQRWGGKQ
ncbi:ABC transporter substrate-binding protein [Variovorax sp. UMC13]|uniref:ABC transporter substrate-binding protein n=1 Tax=Variovorax sp. UMC13 TaxID=1862326 RepID=UPI00160266C9|nr:ABC transporter substrate-binding protein [Variovorax sp. UMC13]MBB1603433.1 ABC transporter substrate-binding protein [Variovorax sp. UMC13]